MENEKIIYAVQDANCTRINCTKELKEMYRISQSMFYKLTKNIFKKYWKKRIEKL